MRIIVFIIALLSGVYTASLFNPVDSTSPCSDSNFHGQSVTGISGQPRVISYKTVNFDASRNYTEAEARALIGKQVRNLTPLNAKCPKDAGNCLNLYVGEVGEIVGILPSLSNTFLIEIQWNERLEDGFQHSGRFVTRAGKEVSFEILD